MTQPNGTELTSAMRASVLARVDRFFFGVLLLSLAVNFTGAGFIAAQDLPAQASDEVVDPGVERWRATMLPLPPKSTPPPTALPTTGPTATVAPRAEPPPPPAAGHPASSADLQRRLAGVGLLGVIGSGAGGPGGLADVLGRGPGDLAAAMEGAQGARPATVAGAGLAQLRGGQAGELATVSPIGTAGAGEVKLVDARALQGLPHGGVHDEPVSLGNTELRADAIAGFVRARKAAFQLCYEHELKRHPTLKGRVIVRFSITPRGRADAIGFEENTLGSDGVTSCLQALIRNWAFPFRPSEDVPVAYPVVFSPTT